MTEPGFKLLLVEPADLLRRTVTLTVRSLGWAEVTEAASYALAEQMCNARGFDGAVIAVDPRPESPCEGLALIHQIRLGLSETPASIPIVALVSSCTQQTLQMLRAFDVARILIKPFKVRDVVDTIDGMRRR